MVLRKTCVACGEEKAASNFYKDERYADHLTPKCKECTKSAVVQNRRDRGIFSRRQVEIVEKKMLCIKCRKWKPTHEMSGDKNHRFGVKTHCKECEAKRKR